MNTVTSVRAANDEPLLQLESATLGSFLLRGLAAECCELVPIFGTTEQQVCEHTGFG